MFKHIRGILIAAAIAAVLLAAAAWLWLDVFVVRRVEVYGSTGTMSGAAVAQASGIEEGASVFHLDTGAAAARINASGVLKVDRIELDYPDTVRIHVEPRRRAAMLNFGGRMRLLDGEGCLVESLAGAPDMDLIYVSGALVRGCSPGRVLLSDADQLQAYQAVMDACAGSSAGIYISELDLADPREIRIITRTGVTVRMGDAGAMQDKLAWMQAAVADLERRNETGGTLDVRSANRADYRPPGMQE